MGIILKSCPFCGQESEFTANPTVVCGPDGEEFGDNLFDIQDWRGLLQSWGN